VLLGNGETRSGRRMMQFRRDPSPKAHPGVAVLHEGWGLWDCGSGLLQLIMQHAERSAPLGWACLAVPAG